MNNSNEKGKSTVEKLLEKTSYELKERLKELTCINNLSNIINDSKLTPEKVYTKILKKIILSFQYPEITEVRLKIEGLEYKTKGFRKTRWMLSNSILLNGEKIGILEISYIKERPGLRDLTFLKEEKHLLNSITQLLSQYAGRKRTELELQKSELKFRTLIEKAPIAISLSRNGIYLYNNRMFLKTFGFRKDTDLTGKQSIKQFAPQCRKEISRHFDLIKENINVPDEYESIGLHADGTEFPIRISISSVNPGGGPINIAFITDITKRRKADRALEESREQLKNFAAHLQSIREEERVFISRELHDNLGQSLTAIRIDLYRLMKKLQDDNRVNNPDEIIRQTKDTISIVDSTIQTVRNIARELRPGALDDLGLLAAIEWQIGEFVKRSGLKCRLKTALKNIEMEQIHAIGVFRIIQESLTNVLRHSGASEVTIKIAEKGNNTVIEIKDNGRGIKESCIASPKSLGLLGMKERALLFGGEFVIKGERGKGTKIILQIPKIKNK